MDPLEIARWQFGITTVYHFLMVPLTIGLGIVVAALETTWLITKKQEFLRMTKFWGKLFLINFIMGVATGIVQEFQFGMAWSEYSRFVGDVFGAPLAMEALLAFFVESTFLGLWIFGWDRLPKVVHAACIWAATLAATLSAYFILVANSWMQHPVGVEIQDGRAVMTDAWAVFTNNTALVTFPHTLFGAFAVAGGFLLGISWYHLHRRRAEGIDTVDADGRVIVGEAPELGAARDKTDYFVWIKSLRIGAVVAIIAFIGVAFSGHAQAQLMFEQQPMKMAAAEAACHDGTGFSVLAVGDLSAQGQTDCSNIVAVFELPGLLSYLANEDFTTPVKGVNTLLPEYQEKYGTTYPNDPMYGANAGQEINYLPIMEVTYWGFRLMITFGGMAAVAAAIALWVTRKGTVYNNKWISRLAVLGILAPFAANSAGWIFTEMGRQPFVVAPNPSFTGIDQVFMFAAAAVSPGVSAGELLFSLIALTLIYLVLLVVEVRLLVRFIRGGIPSAMPELSKKHDDTDGTKNDQHDDDVLAFAY
ncbi:cytochrome ubiquinol oxidase subunit I [Neomicrococcus aestuarii]|uniref:Cytochrome d ubiquinol oxidase subunit I n=1 Tax=Neomicrococcus aestuarii TaxID=556325 RepID=A0A1L2ZKP3_9MICC|nr:cytochrome ubiquinol oxidase subunit I [Neomicrococcus aestuarii]APF39767.1 cytochrome ubiquinol oxidase subunit I [Neomicrococcus aestuarii]MBB5513797.1 cytochrome d ubiquinol oxidase subunit I [Neomicrococcus aestuarii]